MQIQVAVGTTTSGGGFPGQMSHTAYVTYTKCEEALKAIMVSVRRLLHCCHREKLCSQLMYSFFSFFVLDRKTLILEKF